MCQPHSIQTRFFLENSSFEEVKGRTGLNKNIPNYRQVLVSILQVGEQRLSPSGPLGYLTFLTFQFPSE